MESGLAVYVLLFSKPIDFFQPLPYLYEGPPQVHLHRSRLQSGTLPNLAKFEFFHITQQEDAPFTPAEAFNESPNPRHLSASDHPRFR